MQTIPAAVRWQTDTGFGRAIGTTVAMTTNIMDRARIAALDKLFRSGDVNFTKSFWGLTETTFVKACAGGRAIVRQIG
jgi:hypothetical protein